MKSLNKLNLNFLLMALLATPLVSCADTPESAVPARDALTQTQPAEPGDEPTTETVHALKFKGTDTMGRKCNLYVGLLEEDHDGGHHHEAEEEHHLVMKLDYTTLDGHAPHDGEGSFYQYNASTGVYSDEDNASSDTNLVLLTMSLKDGSEAQPNDLNEYIQHAELEQYIRVQFTQNTDAHNFVETLEEALEAEDHSTVDLSVFNNKVQMISLGVAHGDHYHFPACMIQKVESIEETSFDIGGEHDDHDDHSDHDH